jgi:hypothetical protein
VLELCAGKLACTVLRGLGPSNGARPLGKPISKSGKVFTCWTRSGAPKLFAFCGWNNVASALFAISKSLGSRAGAFTIASLL